MNLKKAAKEFGQQKLELKEKEGAILAELEKILFSCPFDYSKETITEIGCNEEAYYIYPCIQLPTEYATYNTEYTIENNVIFKTYNNQGFWSKILCNRNFRTHSKKVWLQNSRHRLYYRNFCTI